MKILKKRSTAVAFVIVAAVVCSLAGVKLSVSRLANKTEKTFYDGVDGETGIQIYLDNACNEAKVIYYTASEYLDEEYTDGLRNAYNTLYDAEAISEKHDCFEELVEEAGAVELLLKTENSIPEDDRSYLELHLKNMDNIRKMIESGSYNARVADFEQSVLNSFPVNVLKGILKLEAPEPFE